MKFVPFFLGDETHVALAQPESIFDLTGPARGLGSTGLRAPLN